MKNKKSLTYTTIILLLGVIIAPNLNANIVQKNINQNQEAQVENSDDYGSIHGYVGVRTFPPPIHIVGAKLVLQGDFNKKITWSGIFGEYRLNNVEVGRQYTLTVTHPKYKTQSQTFTLLADEPDLKINFYMSKKDNARSKTFIEKTECLGSIYGKVRYSPDGYYGDMPAPYTLVKVGKKFDINSIIDSSYKITGLSLNQELIVIYSNPQFKTKTTTVILTNEEPNVELILYYYSEDEKDINPKSRTTYKETEFLGSIYGNTGTCLGWGFTPVPFAKVEAGGKTTISLPIMGRFRINNLPFGTYTITGSKIGYDTFNDIIILTQNNPDKQVFIDLQPNDKGINEKLNQNKLILHTINCFLSLIPSIAR